MPVITYKVNGKQVDINGYKDDIVVLKEPDLIVQSVSKSSYREIIEMIGEGFKHKDFTYTVESMQSLMMIKELADGRFR